MSEVVLKRKDSDDDEQRQTKKARYFYVTLESESPLPTSEDESILTVQGNETEFAHDTSDTTTHSWNSNSDVDDVSVNLEYEVASLSEEEKNPLLIGTSSSDPEDFVTMGVLAAIYNETDMGLADDDSDNSRSTVDSEIGKADYWTCVQCNTKNNNPMFRYCEKCYQIRKNFFPPRPKGKKRRLKKIEAKEISAEEKSAKCQDYLTSLDSGLGSQESKSNLESEDTMKSLAVRTIDGTRSDHSCGKNMESIEDRYIEKVENTDNKTISVGCNTEKSHENDIKNVEFENKLCLTCTINPKNGAFAHGNILHVCCCYKCAVKIWKNSKHCPICNRKITNVLKVYYN